MANSIYHATVINENAANMQLKKIAKSITIKTKGRHISKRLMIGILSILISVTMIIVQPTKLYNRMKLTLMEGGELFELWMKANIEPTAKVYLFNVTNKEEFLTGKQKLSLREVGPYIYKAKSIHEHPVFNHNEGTVFTLPKHAFEWAPEMNTRSENDTFILPNIPLLLFANQFAGRLMPVHIAANMYVAQTSSEPIIRQTVKDVLYGVKSPFISLGNFFVPKWIKFDKFGIFEQISGVTPETSETYTGEKDFHWAGRTAKYNDKTELPQWRAPCNRIVGSSDGKKFGNDIQPNETLYLFHRALCRTIPMVQAGPPTVSDQWLPTVPYKIPDDALDNGENNPENKCYCREGNCLPSGLIDLKGCFYGFSVAVSLPHFYKGNPSLLENIDGLHPDASLHDSEWHLNTKAGVLTNCSVKLQFNLVLGNIEDITCCSRFSNLIVPIAWGEIGFPRLHPTSAIRLFVATQIFPIVEKASIIFWLVVGFYCIYGEMRTATIKEETKKMGILREGKLCRPSCNAVQTVRLLPSS